MKQAIRTPSIERRALLQGMTGMLVCCSGLPANLSHCRLEHEAPTSIQHSTISLGIPQYEAVSSAEHESYRFVLVGDTQRTSWFEQWFLGREQNDHERLQILHAIARELSADVASDVISDVAAEALQRASVLVLLGDHVCYGEDAEDWRYFDDIFAPVRREIERWHTPIIALAGNHDYGLVQRSQRWLSAMTQRFMPLRCGADGLPRFPALARFGSTALLVLDSNVDMMSAQAVDHQYRQYCRALEYLDAAPSIASVLVAAHHPPITNSNLAPDPALMRLVAEPFLAASKTRLLLAGHVHSYERFEYTTASGRKFFVTSGGGGGPRRAVRTDAARPHTNDCYRNGSVRPFHYIRLTVHNAALQGEVVMLHSNGTLSVGDTFALRWE